MNKECNFVMYWKIIREKGKLEFYKLHIKSNTISFLLSFIIYTILSVLFNDFNVHSIIIALIGIGMFYVLSPFITWNFNEIKYRNLLNK